ncbi:MAG: hypothetical protein QOD44_2275 [Solirubrobacteraceae bacterium]|jgi:uncharacterized OB-fold protein|nr:hypothetical protein [Solirubrobacteraceae bacterium]
MATNPAERTLQIRDFPGAGEDPEHLMPRVTRDNAPFFDGLAEGRLALQECGDCGRVRYPVAPVCPHCGGRALRWRELSGGGTVHSFIRYRRPYLPEFEALVPYIVLCVELDEGARLFGRLAGPAEAEVGARVQAIVERWPSGRCVHAFVPAQEGEDR